MSAWYEPGNQIALVHDDRAVIVPADASPHLIEALWALLCDSADLVDLTGAVATHGLRSLPSIAIVVDLDGPNPRAVLRGEARLEAGSVVLGADGTASWNELELEPGPIRLYLGGDEDAVGDAMPVRRAVVRASSLTWREDAPAPRHADSPALEPTAAEVTWAARDGRTVDAEVPEPVAPDEGRLAPPPDATSRAGQTPAPAGAEEQSRGVSLNETLTVDDVLPTPTGGRHAAMGAPEVEHPASADAYESPASDEAGPVEDDNDYDRLFGATEHLRRRALHDQEASAVPVAETDAKSAERSTETQTLAQPEPVEASEVPAAPLVAGSELADPPATTGAGLISQVPLIGASPVASPISAAPPASRPSAPAAAVSPTSVPVGDGAASQQPLDMTVSRVGLAAATAQGPLVHAVRCPSGHANPAEAVTCRQCGTEVPPQSAITVPRPPLGALVLVSGPLEAPARVPLEGPLVLGRRPQVDRVTSAVPRLVEIPSPESDLSRNHLRVGIEGWHVLVTDLSSTNGTVITVPGEEPQRLRASEPTLIPPGTVLVMAEVVSYRFEVGG